MRLRLDFIGFRLVFLGWGSLNSTLSTQNTILRRYLLLLGTQNHDFEGQIVTFSGSNRRFWVTNRRFGVLNHGFR